MQGVLLAAEIGILFAHVVCHAPPGEAGIVALVELAIGVPWLTERIFAQPAGVAHRLRE